MGSDTIDLLMVVAAVIVVIYVFIRIAIRTRKHGGSMTTTMHAATFEFLDKDKQQAAQEVVERKAGKKMEEENSGDTVD
jgi:hypothetical protein